MLQKLLPTRLVVTQTARGTQVERITDNAGNVILKQVFPRDTSLYKSMSTTYVGGRPALVQKSAYLEGGGRVNVTYTNH